MNQIKIAFSDFPGPANPTAILALLRKHFEVIVDENRPDYLFYSVFGSKFLDSPAAIRIFITGENVHPDFNLCDYAFGFDWMKLEDRYCRCPNYQLYEEFFDLRGRGRVIEPAVEATSKKRFCNFIYSNADAHPFREVLFHKLGEYKGIDSAGSYLNTTGFLVGSPSLGESATRNKIAFQQECKFSITIENSSTIGYTTEKLIHGLVADTIPIYWGNPEVGREFNTRRFINCHDYPSIDEVVERVREIDSDDRLYREILSEPVFPNGQVPEALKEETVVAQFRHIFNQGREGLRRQPYVWGKRYEQQRRVESRPPSLAGWLKHKGALLRSNRLIAGFRYRIKKVSSPLTRWTPND